MMPEMVCILIGVSCVGNGSNLMNIESYKTYCKNRVGATNSRHLVSLFGCFFIETRGNTTWFL